MAAVTDFNPLVVSIPAAIASGQTASGEIDLHGTTLSGVFIPSTMTGTSFTIQVASASGGTFVTAKDSNGTNRSWTIPTSGGCYTDIDPAISAGWRFIKIVSGSTEASARSLTVAARPY